MRKIIAQFFLQSRFVMRKDSVLGINFYLLYDKSLKQYERMHSGMFTYF
jgi:hypothetical protein